MRVYKRIYYQFFSHVTEACIYILKEYRMCLSSEANSIYTFTSTNQYLPLLARNPCIFIHTVSNRDAVVSCQLYQSASVSESGKNRTSY